jgi:hypothetical protein
MSIYFIYEKPDVPLLDLVTEFKIGESINPLERLKQLQTGNKRLLIIYQTIFCGTKAEAQQLEATIHERLQSKHVRGEWFKVTKKEVDDLIAEIKKLRDAELALAKKRYSQTIIAPIMQ